MSFLLKKKKVIINNAAVKSLEHEFWLKFPRKGVPTVMSVNI